MTLLVLATTDPAADPSDTVAALKKAWAERQERTKSGKFVITRKATYGKGSLTGPRSKEKGLTIPPEDATFDEPVVIAFDGEKLRYEYEKKAWSEQKKQYWQYPYISTCNGNRVKQLIASNSEGWPQGVIRPGHEHTDANNIHCFPVLLTYRTLIPTMSSIANHPMTEKQRGLVDGRECIVFDVDMSIPMQKIMIYVDPSRDYSIVRLIQSSGQRVLADLAIQHKYDPVYRWIPISWDAAIKPAESPRIYNSQVKEYMLNVPMASGYFDIDFPAGTIVNDLTSKPPSKYLVKPTGVARPIPREEVTATYEQLMNTEPGEAHNWQPPSSYRWLFITCLVTAAVVVAWWLLLRIRTTARP